MLNYIWGGLIIFSLVFALVGDANDMRTDRWQNGREVAVEVVFAVNADLGRNQDVRLRIVPAEADAGVVEIGARWHPVDDAAEFVIPVSAALPLHWREVAANQESSRRQELRVVVAGRLVPDAQDGARFTGFVVLPEVNFVKLRAITKAAFDMAEFAVTPAIGLIGIMALWLGLMNVADRSGLIQIVVRGVRPFMKWLFLELPRDHPAMGMISLNLAANILGLGNAATPMGIKAMEELQKLNPDKDSATNSMCMFLALNTSSVQLLPPVTLVAIMGLRVNELMVAITITTIFSTAAAIVAAKWYARRNPPTEAALAMASDWQAGRAAMAPSAGSVTGAATAPSAGKLASGKTNISESNKENEA